MALDPVYLERVLARPPLGMTVALHDRDASLTFVPGPAPEPCGEAVGVILEVALQPEGDRSVWKPSEQALLAVESGQARLLAPEEVAELVLHWLPVATLAPEDAPVRLGEWSTMLRTDRSGRVRTVLLRSVAELAGQAS